MKRIGVWIVGIALAVGGLSVVHADDVLNDATPSWANRSSYVRGDRLFAVGIAVGARTLEEGRQTAFDAAKREIRNFAQIHNIAGVDISTERTYQVQGKDNSFTVYRLISVDRNQLDAWKKQVIESGTDTPETPSSQTSPQATEAKNTPSDENTTGKTIIVHHVQGDQSIPTTSESGESGTVFYAPPQPSGEYGPGEGAPTQPPVVINNNNGYAAPYYYAPLVPIVGASTTWQRRPRPHPRENRPYRRRRE